VIPVVIPIAAPVGIDPDCGGAVFPENPADPTGPGIVTGLDPDTIDPGWLPDDDGAPPPVPDLDVVPEEPIVAEWQNTRYVTLCNACKHKVKLFITYETLNEADEIVEDSVDVELDPNEVCDLEQDGWLVNATRIRIFARCADGTVLKKFRDEWMNLVPETDEEGVPGYASPSVQRASIAIR
jgi:hypothetical protein